MSLIKKARLPRHVAEVLGMDLGKVDAMGDGHLLALRTRAKESRRPAHLSGYDIWEIVDWWFRQGWDRRCPTLPRIFSHG